jgi:hypothetical protein
MSSGDFVGRPDNRNGGKGESEQEENSFGFHRMRLAYLVTD